METYLWVLLAITVAIPAVAGIALYLIFRGRAKRKWAERVDAEAEREIAVEDYAAALQVYENAPANTPADQIAKLRESVRDALADLMRAHAELRKVRPEIGSVGPRVPLRLSEFRGGRTIQRPHWR
jgi:hypothetical protein